MNVCTDHAFHQQVSHKAGIALSSCLTVAQNEMAIHACIPEHRGTAFLGLHLLIDQGLNLRNGSVNDVQEQVSGSIHASILDHTLMPLQSLEHDSIGFRLW